MNPTFLVLSLLALASLTHAHMCLFSPVQRGTMNNVNTPASPDCGLTTGPCGSRGAQNPLIAVQSGGNLTVVFQKNLNHYYAPAPGFFNVTLAVTPSSAPIRLASIPDTNTASLYVYTVSVTLPLVLSSHAVLGVQYDTNSEPGIFYQCTDISISKF
eukprot:TRINITY_DN11324_c0_g1_i1.p2 TRINITY_DN11324_c0_g1~~TRINITY_DN11324_c0_g1_i1.p2  ORF type:complete len:175 (-),score=53.14 TRINITY_DN11324_c0_g1_i1:90-560(-)